MAWSRPTTTTKSTCRRHVTWTRVASPMTRTCRRTASTAVTTGMWSEYILKLAVHILTFWIINLWTKIMCQRDWNTESLFVLRETRLNFCETWSSKMKIWFQIHRQYKSPAVTPVSWELSKDNIDSDWIEKRAQQNHDLLDFLLVVYNFSSIVSNNYIEYLRTLNKRKASIKGTPHQYCANFFFSVYFSIKFLFFEKIILYTNKASKIIK